jgi:hypothetical protein
MIVVPSADTLDWTNIASNDNVSSLIVPPHQVRHERYRAEVNQPPERTDRQKATEGHTEGARRHRHHIEGWKTEDGADQHHGDRRPWTTNETRLPSTQDGFETATSRSL